MQYGGTAYAVPLTSAGQAVRVSLTERDEVVSSTPQGAVVVRHPLATQRGGQVGSPPRPAPGPPGRAAPALDAAPRAVPPDRGTAQVPQVEVRSLQEYDALLEGRDD